MRNSLKNLWDAIVDNQNEDRFFDLICLFSLMLNNEIYPNEIKELKEYTRRVM